jgi:hypothetical protein
MQGLTVSSSILTHRSQYRSCHVRLPNEAQRIAAIAVHDKYYSLVKVVKDRAKALKICDRLTNLGNETLITCLAKGDAIWVWERDAIPERRGKELQRERPQVLPSTYRILEPHQSYQNCQIRVDMSLAAITLDGKYYTLFKLVDTRAKAVALAQKLLSNGDAIVITTVESRYGVWVMELEASLYVER